MLSQLLGIAGFAAAIFLIWKYALQSDVKHIIHLNKEATRGNPDPQKLERVYRFLVFKILVLAAVLYIILIFLRRFGINQ